MTESGSVPDAARKGTLLLEGVLKRLDKAESFEDWDGIIDGLGPGRAIVEMLMVSPGTSDAIAEAVPDEHIPLFQQAAEIGRRLASKDDLLRVREAVDADMNTFQQSRAAHLARAIDPFHECSGRTYVDLDARSVSLRVFAGRDSEVDFTKSLDEMLRFVGTLITWTIESLGQLGEFQEEARLRLVDQAELRHLASRLTSEVEELRGAVDALASVTDES